jgi:flagellar capping protein FliD
MAKKSPVNRTPNVGRQLTSLERLVRTGFQRTQQRFGQVDKRFGQIDKRIDRLDQRVAGIEIEMRASKREMKDHFTRMEESIGHLANHVDGFMKFTKPWTSRCA